MLCDLPIEWFDFQRNTVEYFLGWKLEHDITQLDDVIRRLAHGKNTM